MSIKGRTLLAAGPAATATVAGIGLLGGQPRASAAGTISYDTGSGLTFVVDSTNGPPPAVRCQPSAVRRPPLVLR